ncbi:MAG: hypothetical protein Q8N69_00180 [bacterium]|nr:hypothetical protein [bacterium]
MNKKIIFLAAGFVLIVVILAIFLNKENENQQPLANRSELPAGNESGQNDFEALKAAIKKSIRDLDLNLDESCSESPGHFWCEGSDDSEGVCPNIFSFKIGASEKSYGSWAGSWNFLLNKANKQSGGEVFRISPSGIDGYGQTIYENTAPGEKCSGSCSAGNYKRIEETASAHLNGYGITTQINIEGPKGERPELIRCIGVPDRIDRPSAFRILEKIISNAGK